MVDSRALIKAVFRKISNFFSKPWVRHAVAIAALAFASITIARMWKDIFSYEILANVSTSPVSITSIVVVAVLASLLRSERLYVLLKVTDQPVRRGLAYISFAYGLLLSFTPAKSAELLRFSHGSDTERVRLGLSARLFFLEKLVDVVAVCLISCAVFVSLWVALAMLMLGVLLARPIERGFLRSGGNGLATIWSFALATLAWVIEGTVLYVLLIHLTQITLSPSSIVGGFALSSFIGALSFVPGGILVSEIAFLKLLDSGSGIIFTMVLVFRITILLTNLLIGISAWGLLLLRQQLSAASQPD